MIKCTFEDGGTGSLRHIVVHAIVIFDGKILLQRRASNLLEADKLALPGGFLSRNETASEAALRELTEETGFAGEIVDLFRINSKPDRPREDRQNVVMEFIVKPLNKIGEMDKEVTEIVWVDLEKITDYKQFAFDHGETIKLYKNYLRSRFKLPLFS